jgi:hypothetical protein
MADLTEIKALLDSMIPDKPVPDAVWVTRDGRRIHIVDMTDKHLVNTLLYLKRKYQATIEFAQKDNWRTFLSPALRVKVYRMEEEVTKRGILNWESRSPIRE